MSFGLAGATVFPASDATAWSTLRVDGGYLSFGF